MGHHGREVEALPARQEDAPVEDGRCKEPKESKHQPAERHRLRHVDHQVRQALAAAHERLLGIQLPGSPSLDIDAAEHRGQRLVPPRVQPLQCALHCLVRRPDGSHVRRWQRRHAGADAAGTCRAPLARQKLARDGQSHLALALLRLRQHEEQGRPARHHIHECAVPVRGGAREQHAAGHLARVDPAKAQEALLL